MSGNVINSLKGFKAQQEEKERRREEAANRANWFAIGNAKEKRTAVNVQFLQELDPDSKNYNEANGTALFAVERVSPDDFRKRALDTLETEGKSYPEEWHRAARATEGDKYQGGWRARNNFYITALVEKEDGSFETQIIQRNSSSSFVEDLIEIYEEEDTITDRVYEIRKSGDGTQTRWKLKEAKGAKTFPVGDHTAYDLLKTAVRSVPYAEQPVFYGKVVAGEEPATEKVSDDAEW